MATDKHSIGIFGGTFDPVHIGHLRSAVELRQHLGLSAMHMLPSAQPPHRDAPATSAKHRLAMLQLALSNEPGMVADDCELQRSGPSYSIDTLQQFRANLGEASPLYLCIGMDALLGINSWHRWQELLSYAHIVVTARPGWELPKDGEVVDWIHQHRTGESRLADSSCGKLVVVEMTLLPVSATAIRQAMQRGESIRYLVPDAVINYMHQHRLYAV